MQAWFSTELLLTQNRIEFGDDESGFFLKPHLSVDSFEWHSKPAIMPVLLEGDRDCSYERVFWFNPLPKYPHREDSDWYDSYQDAIDESLRRGAKGKDFTHLGFVMTVWYLHLLINQELEDEFEWPIEEFLEKHRVSLAPLLGLIEASEFRGLLDSWIQIPSQASEFILGLSLPENAREIWEDYLELLHFPPFVWASTKFNRIVRTRKLSSSTRASSEVVVLTDFGGRSSKFYSEKEHSENQALYTGISRAREECVLLRNLD
jgi:hypothetical protein